jgi:anti-anti-sigma factor
MKRPHQQTAVDHEGSVTTVRIVPRRLDEPVIEALGDELTSLIEQDRCRWIVLSLGPGNLECLFSIFMAKLVGLQRRLQEHEGALILCDVSPDVMTVFEACRLKSYFEFAPDRAAAVEAMKRKIV